MAFCLPLSVKMKMCGNGTPVCLGWSTTDSLGLFCPDSPFLLVISITKVHCSCARVQNY